MILDTRECKIKYIGFDFRVRYFNEKLEPVNSLKDYFCLCDLGTLPENSIFYNYYKTNGIKPSTATGIFLGDLNNINCIIDKKEKVKDFSSIKKIYFDHCCKFPRFKLKELSNIKRVNSPNKADVIVIDDTVPFDIYNPITRYGYKEIKCLITYSKKDNCYYLLDYYPSGILYNREETRIYYSYLGKYTNSGINSIQEFKSILTKINILPIDTVEVYYGNIILLKNIDEISYLNGILSNYNKIAFSSDLDKYLFKDKETSISGDLKSIIEMLNSSDKITIDLGVKLLSLCNINSLPSTISGIIIYNWHDIKNLPSTKSTLFKQTLKTLGLSGNLSNCTYHYINKLYEKATNDLDKQKFKEFISLVVFREMRKIINETTKKYSSIPLDINFTVS